MILEAEVNRAPPALIAEAAEILCASHTAERPVELAMSKAQAVRNLSIVAEGRIRNLILQSTGFGRALCVVDTKSSTRASTARCAIYVETDLSEGDLRSLTDRLLQLTGELGASTVQLTYPSRFNLANDLERLSFSPRSATVELLRPVRPLPMTDRTYAGAFELIGFQNTCPAAFVEAYCDLKTDLARSVRGDRLSDPVMVDVMRLRADEAAATARGTPIIGVLALDTAGRLVGFADFLRNAPNPRCAMHQDTVIAADLRSQGYGARLKAQALLWLAAALPDVCHVWTRNNVINYAITTLNARLGYSEVAKLPWVELSR